jgi:hypothetical protein
MRNSMLNRKSILAAALAVFALASAGILPVLAADVLSPSDFGLESWSKTVDFLHYARLYAVAHGKPLPDPDSHAYLYLTYVNSTGMQMVYGGLINITDGARTVTLPIQSWMMHYKSENGSKDLVTAASFIMLLAFNESSNTIYTDSPDINDTLYASFNLGFDLTSKFGSETAPGLSSKATVIQLTSTPDKLNWHWGLKYTDLTAIWWQTSIDPEKPGNMFVAVSRYDELTFTYDLSLNPDEGTATLTANYIIGKMTDLWVFNFGFFGLIFPGLLSVHFNSTGCYILNGKLKVSPETIYQFLDNQNIKMSIVQFQSTVVLDHTAYHTSSGTNVTDNDVFVSDSDITTSTEDGEKIFDADFGSKETYNLYNYTDDSTETHYETYNTTTRTAKIAGFAGNGLFGLHTVLMRYIPLVVAHMDPALYQQARDHLLDFSYADYFYITSYPTYSGYRVEHDPTYTAYYSSAAAATPTFPVGPIIIVVAIVTVALISVAVVLRRKSSKPSSSFRQPNKRDMHPPPPPPSP